MGYHVSQERVRGDVERDAETHVRRSLRAMRQGRCEAINVMATETCKKLNFIYKEKLGMSEPDYVCVWQQSRYG